MNETSTAVDAVGAGPQFCRTGCSVCVHGYDTGPELGARVLCAPKNRVFEANYRCTGFRRITHTELDERESAKFGVEG